MYDSRVRTGCISDLDQLRCWRHNYLCAKREGERDRVKLQVIETELVIRDNDEFRGRIIPDDGM